MATAEVYEQWRPIFERLFANPAIPAMMPPHLESTIFEQIIRYVFDCAGYAAIVIVLQVPAVR